MDTHQFAICVRQKYGNAFTNIHSTPSEFDAIRYAHLWKTNLPLDDVRVNRPSGECLVSL